MACLWGIAPGSRKTRRRGRNSRLDNGWFLIAFTLAFGHACALLVTALVSKAQAVSAVRAAFDGKPGDAQAHCDELLVHVVTTAVAADEHKALAVLRSGAADAAPRGEGPALRPGARCTPRKARRACIRRYVECMTFSDPA